VPHLTIHNFARLFVVVLLLAAFVPWVGAGDSSLPNFTLPLQCDIGRNCFIQNYVDQDPGPGYRDYRCGSLSYDGHTGADFRVGWKALSGEGVPVVAAAAGRVVAVRDGVPDRHFRKSDGPALKGHELGNAVVIDHGNGWKTFYGHMRSGSVAVKKSDAVKAGQPLGRVGLSGKTEFPHVHFEVRHGKALVDPFVGDEAKRKTECGPGETPLWAPETMVSLNYVPTGVVATGFAGETPSLDRIEAVGEEFPAVSPESPVLAFWATIYGVRKGDIVKLRLVAPDGCIMAEQKARIPRDQAQWLGFVGRRRKANHWPAGEYRGECEVTGRANSPGRPPLVVVRKIELR
jgi:murein DD-endopeptidase MepM/ murein hydrolase activator NlpD